MVCVLLTFSLLPLSQGVLLPPFPNPMNGERCGDMSSSPAAASSGPSISGWDLCHPQRTREGPEHGKRTGITLSCCSHTRDCAGGWKSRPPPHGFPFGCLPLPIHVVPTGTRTRPPSFPQVTLSVNTLSQRRELVRSGSQEGGGGTLLTEGAAVAPSSATFQSPA